jgi:hypothetical protein
MLLLPVVLLILVAHWLGDFVFQTDEMAIAKSKSNVALGTHVVMVTGWLAIVAVVVVLCSLTTVEHAGMWVLVNALAHFVTDYFTSRVTSRLFFFHPLPGQWEQMDYNAAKGSKSVTQTVIDPWLPIWENRHNFFVTIGFDQMLHMVVLLSTASLWL